MKKTRRTVEQIIRILREADSGVSVEQVCRAHNVSAQSYYRWKQKYGGMGLGEAQRLREIGVPPKFEPVAMRDLVGVSV